VHHPLHVHFLLAGYLFFAWAVAGPDPAPRPGMGLRIAVVVAAGGAHSLLAKLLYSRAPALPSGGGHSTAEMELATRRCTTAGTWLT
jgi:putative membrane protein